MPTGFSFQPGADASATPNQPIPGPGLGQNRSPQQAVRILSLRVPNSLPATAPVSRDLLNGSGSAGPGGSALTSMVRALMEAFKPSAPVAGPQFPLAPPGLSQTGGRTMQPPMQPTFPSGAPQPTPPQPQGQIDTAPMQNAPPLLQPGQPLFDQSPDQQNAYGNPWQALGMDDSEQRQAYLNQVMQQYIDSLQNAQRPRSNAPSFPSVLIGQGGQPTGGSNA